VTDENKHQHNVIYRAVEAVDDAGDEIFKDVENLLTTHTHDGGDEPHSHDAGRDPESKPELKPAESVPTGQQGWPVSWYENGSS
jgi:hypothetical protein